jgi:drug/metabolite transporter (DMT)-like permease
MKMSNSTVPYSPPQSSNFQTEASRTRIITIAAFAAVYILWGSTYLAIAFSIETLPPFLMAGVRFATAGAILYVWSRVRGAPRPTLLHLRSATITGALMFLAGNGVLGWAEQYVPSGLAALLIASVPLWIVVLSALGSRQRPTRMVSAGILLGLTGIILLVGPENLGGSAAGTDRMLLIGLVTLLFAALSWSLGTLYSRRSPRPTSQVMASGLDMLAGGLLLTIFAALKGEWAQFNSAAVSVQSWLALAYLIVFGSLIGYSAYMWLVKETTPTKASSSFYVNPVVAVFLGWLVAGEALTPRTVIAASIIVAGVFLIVNRDLRLPRLSLWRKKASAQATASPPCP